MKKLLPILLVLLLLLTACGEAQDIPETTGPDAPSTAATQPAETVSDDGPEGVTEAKDTVTVYLLTQMARLDENGEVLWYLAYSYDSLGRLAGQREVLAGGEESYSVVITYTDTESGREAHHTSYPSGETYSVRETWDDQGNLIRKEHLHHGEVDYCTEYTYDADGNLTADETHYSGDPGVPRNVYTYDAQGNRTGCAQYQSGTLVSRQEMTYDEEGRLTGTVFYGADGAVISRSECTWEGTISTAVWYYGDGTLSYTEITTYDGEGRITLSEIQYPEGAATMTEYTYEPIEIEK